MKRILPYILAPAFILSVSALLSRVLGVFRDHLLARYFGAGEALDAYYAAFLVPDVLYALLILTSLSSVFLPQFQKYKVNGDTEASFRFASSVLNTATLGIGIMAFIVMLMANFLVDVLFPKFLIEQKELTVTMLRIMMISPICFTLSSVMITVENAYKQFFGQSLAPIMYNLGIILGIIFLSSNYGVLGVSYGVIGGAIMQVLIQVPFFAKTGFTYSAILLKGKELKEMATHFLPRLLSSSVAQISYAINVIIGATLLSGSITLYNLAFNVQSIAFGVIAVSISIPAFALLTEDAAKNDMKSFTKHLKENFEKILFWIIPSGVGLYIVAEPLVKFLFEYGSFNAQDSTILVSLVHIFSLGLILNSWIILFAKAYLAIQKTWFITKIGIVTMCIDIVLSLYLSSIIGVAGLVWASVIALTFEACLLMYFSWKHFGACVSLKNLFFMLFMSCVMYLVLSFMVLPMVESFSALLQLVIICVLGGGVYILGMMGVKKVRS